MARALAHARQHKEATAKDAEGMLLRRPGLSAVVSRKQDEGGKESLDRKWVA
jgi:hypothetical protein